MAQTEPPANELDRALELADRHLSEAETIRWTATDSIAAEDMADAVEHLTHDLWAVQHQLQDRQRELGDDSCHPAYATWTAPFLTPLGLPFGALAGVPR